MTDTTRPTVISSLSPRLVVSGAARAIDFYVAAFGSRELVRYTDAQDRIVHAEVTIGGSTVVVKDEDDADPAPTTLGGSPVIFELLVNDADALAEAMVSAGATVLYPVQDQPYGQRGGRLADPFGHRWAIAHQTEDLTPAEIQRRTRTTHES